MAKNTTDQIVTAFRLINKAKLSKMEDAEKFAFIKSVREMKKVNADFEDFLRLTQEKLRPDNFEEISSKMQSGTELSASETAIVDKYNRDVSECIKEELDKEIELTYERMSEDAFGRFVASNDFSVSEIIAIEDVIGG